MPVKGFKELTKDLQKLSSKMKELDGTHSVSMDQILNPIFISKHTRFNSLEELFKAGGFEFETEEEFKAIPQEEMDAFIANESKFPDWQAMIKEAGAEWVKSKLAL